MKKIILLVILMLSVTIGNAKNIIGSKMPAQSLGIISKVIEQTQNSNFTLSTAELSYPFSEKNNQIYVDLLLQYSNKSIIDYLKSIGCVVITSTKSVVAVSAPLDKLKEIESVNYVNRIEVGKIFSFKMDSCRIAINGDEVLAKISGGQPQVIGGEGVILGLVDSGLDLAHPDFYNENGTRVLKLWDISDKTNINPPEEFGFGRQYDKTELDLNIDEILHIDFHGHGTHVIGIAAGSGNEDERYRGVAYNSDLIIVKALRTDDTAWFSDGDIIAACNYIFDNAEKLGRPAVINISLGSILGSHDGKGLLSVALSDLTGPGRIIVCSAGNSAETPMHAGGEVVAGEMVEFPIKPVNVCNMLEYFCPDLPDFYRIAGDFWYSEAIIDSAYLVVYKITESGYVYDNKYPFDLTVPVGLEMIEDKDSNTIGFFSYTHNPSVPLSEAGNLMFQVENEGHQEIDVKGYVWSVAFKVKEAGTIDMWGSLPMPEAETFTPEIGERYFFGDNAMTIVSPGDGDSIISVASYVTKNQWIDVNSELVEKPYVIGEISTFSSLGPDRLRRIKPTIAAPGQSIVACKSKDCEFPDPYVLEGGYYAALYGTSMATPVVSGAVAIMLQVKPDLTFSDVSNILRHTAVNDEFTGETPNNTFGYGKIDLQAAINYILGATGVSYVYANDVKVYPNPAVSQIVLEIDDSIDNPTVDLYSSNGNIIASNLDYSIEIAGGKTKITLNTSNLSPGVYNASCISGNKIARFRFVVSPR